MSAIKRFMKDSLERLKVDELLRKELRDSGYGGISITRTPMGTQIALYTMRPGRVIGKRGQNIKELSERLEKELGIPNPQVAVVEVEVPELDPYIMASRIAMAIERGVHYRRAIFWAARRIMAAGAQGVEIVVKGKLRSNRSRYEVVREGFIPKAGQPALEHVRTATIPVKLKLGVQGITVTIVPPDAEFPDKISLEGLPEMAEEEEEVSPTEEVGEAEEPVEGEGKEEERDADSEGA
ncbi:30S ribosomal protein S3 [Candidatus Bathyarchaeota archaeon]|nr:MAG: 30S ribosomal protein S3 [Candidatus Bathyarchaeota archaeon]